MPTFRVHVSYPLDLFLEYLGVCLFHALNCRQLPYDRLLRCIIAKLTLGRSRNIHL